MIVDAGARRLTQIHAEVEPLRLHGFVQNPDGEIHKNKEFLSLRGEKIGQTAQVTERNDHEVAAGVGIAVHHDVAAFPLAEDQAIPQRGILAENAARGLFPPDIGGAPGRKDRVHSVTPEQDGRPFQRSFPNIGDRSDHNPAEHPAHEPADYNEMTQKDKDYFGVEPLPFRLTFRMTGVRMRLKNASRG